MVETVISFVPPTVNTTHVTFRMDIVLDVNLDGLGYIATLHVVKAGTVIVVVRNVEGIAEITLPVIT